MRWNEIPYRFLRKCRRFLRFQAARRDPPIVCENLYPFPTPRELFPADVRPRISRCFMTALQIQLIFGSRRIALCDGSTKITSKYLYEESWATQYELSTRSPPRRRPTRSWNYTKWWHEYRGKSICWLWLQDVNLFRHLRKAKVESSQRIGHVILGIITKYSIGNEKFYGNDNYLSNWL